MNEHTPSDGSSRSKYQRPDTSDEFLEMPKSENASAEELLPRTKVNDETAITCQGQLPSQVLVDGEASAADIISTSAPMYPPWLLTSSREGGASSEVCFFLPSCAMFHLACDDETHCCMVDNRALFVPSFFFFPQFLYRKTALLR